MSRYRAVGAIIPCDMAQEQYDTSATRRAIGFVWRYNFCIVTGGGDDMETCARDTVCDMASARYDTAWHSHDTAE